MDVVVVAVVAEFLPTGFLTLMPKLPLLPRLVRALTVLTLPPFSCPASLSWSPAPGLVLALCLLTGRILLGEGLGLSLPSTSTSTSGLSVEAGLWPLTLSLCCLSAVAPGLPSCPALAWPRLLCPPRNLCLTTLLKLGGRLTRPWLADLSSSSSFTVSPALLSSPSLKAGVPAVVGVLVALTLPRDRLIVLGFSVTLGEEENRLSFLATLGSWISLILLPGTLCLLCTLLVFLGLATVTSSKSPSGTPGP